jgi:hypothetical protein
MNGNSYGHLLCINYQLAWPDAFFLPEARALKNAPVETRGALPATASWIAQHKLAFREPITLFHPSLNAAGPNRASCRQWR